ncbi:MAG: M90 family metallopeptidase [Methylococcales bacterium]
MNIFKRAWIRYILHRHVIAHNLWLDNTDNLPVLKGLIAVEKAHLRELTTLFLHEKNFIGTHGLQITNAMAISIAVQACLPVLNLGIGCLNGWKDIVVYPAAFHISRDNMDALGIVHHEEKLLAGESWSRGPVILSWEEVERDAQGLQVGCNVVIHEIAHKLDMLNGSANGFPPLHYSMDIREWTHVMSSAYRELVERLEHQHRVSINPYAATSPGEFFAVCTEYFFCAPEILHTHFPEVHLQLQHYYRQDPLGRNAD